MRKKIISILAGIAAGLFTSFVYRIFKVVGSSGMSIISSIGSGDTAASGLNMHAITKGLLTDHTFWYVFFMAFLVMAGIVFIKFTLYGKEDEDRHFYYSRKGTYGTSTEMTRSEFDRELKSVKMLSNANDFIFGEKGKSFITINEKNMRPDDNRNVMVVGSMGSKKSQAIIRVNMLQCIKMGLSMLITDPSGDIYRDMSRTLEQAGYTVKVWNTINPNASDSIDALGAAYESDSIDVFSNTIISNTQSGKIGETFYEGATNSLMNALCHLVTTQEYMNRYLNGRRGTLEDARAALASFSETELNQIFMLDLPKGCAAQEYWNGFQKSSNTGNTISDLLNRMSLWIRPEIKAMTSVPDIDLTLPGKKKCAYFIITSDQDNTRSALSALFFQMLTISLVREADKNENNLLVRPVHLFLDEFVHIGDMGNFTDQLGTWRKRGISCTIVTQSYGDLAKVYKEWEAIVNGCRYNVYMGCSDMMTLEYYEKLAGISTARTKNNRTDAVQAVDLGVRMKGETERPTVRADEFRTLNPDYLYLTVYGCHVLKLKKHYFYEDPRGKKINAEKESLKQNADEHIPKWRELNNPYLASQIRRSKPKEAMATSSDVTATAAAEKERNRILGEEKADKKRWSLGEERGKKDSESNGRSRNADTVLRESASKQGKGEKKEKTLVDLLNGQ